MQQNVVSLSSLTLQKELQAEELALQSQDFTHSLKVGLAIGTILPGTYSKLLIKVLRSEHRIVPGLRTVTMVIHGLHSAPFLDAKPGEGHSMSRCSVDDIGSRPDSGGRTC